MDKNIKYRDGVPSNAVPAGVVKFFGPDAIAGSQYGGAPPFDYKGAIDRDIQEIV